MPAPGSPSCAGGSTRQIPRGPLPEMGRPCGHPSPGSQALPGPARPPAALTVPGKAVMRRPAKFAPPAHPQHLAAPLQPSRGLPHGCGRRMAGRAAARARLGIREAAQALPSRPAAPPPAAKMAAGRGPSSNHFRFLCGRRGRWRECFPAEGQGWRKCTGPRRRLGVPRLPDRKPPLLMLRSPRHSLATPRGNRKPIASGFVVARKPLAVRWRRLAVGPWLRPSRRGAHRDGRRETVRAAYPLWMKPAVQTGPDRVR